MILSVDSDNYNKFDFYSELLTDAEAKRNFIALFEKQPSLTTKKAYKDYCDYVFGNRIAKDAIMEAFELKVFSMVGGYRDYSKYHLSIDDIEDYLTAEFEELLNKMVYSLYLEFDSEDKVESSVDEDMYFIVVDDETGEYLGKFSSEKAAYEFGESSGYDYRIITETKKKYSDFYRNKYRK